MGTRNGIGFFGGLCGGRCGLACGLWTILLLAGSGAPLAAELYGVRSQEIQDGFEAAIEGFAFEDDSLGRHLAVGDFNCDGRDDLAIHDNESITDDQEGAVHVLYSNADGLPGTDQVWKDFNPSNGSNDRELDDLFGWALAAGNFDGNSFGGHGCDDLAIGIPGEDVSGAPDAGGVLILYGFPFSGLASASNPGAWRWTLGADGIGGTPAAGENLGHSLASGDFDNDGRDDLAIGIPLADDGGTFNSGEVLVMYGTTASGLAPADHRIFSQNSSGGDGTMLDIAEAQDLFGYTLVAGDFNQDGADDLAVGIPGEDIGGGLSAGAVQVLYGFTNTGLRLTGNQFWNETNVDTGGLAETNDNFGFALAAGDVTGEGAEDLVIGAPYEDTDGFEDAGAVTLLWGQLGVGLATAGSLLFDQGDLGDGESPGPLENFGYSLATGDLIEANGPGAGDVAIGILQERVLDPDGTTDWVAAGGVTVVPGGFGLVPADAVFWAQGYRGSAGASHLNVGQLYGHALAAGDFDGDGHDDLAVGAPSVNGQLGPTTTGINSGAVYILYGALFADSFESADSSYWSASAP